VRHVREQPGTHLIGNGAEALSPTTANSEPVTIIFGLCPWRAVQPARNNDPVLAYRA
jgi:hypothetical protein